LTAPKTVIRVFPIQLFIQNFLQRAGDIITEGVYEDLSLQLTDHPVLSKHLSKAYNNWQEEK
jgi:hypothetical protein